MLLVGTYLSPFARRVAAALISRGIEFEHEDLNGYADPVRAQELNPVGRVPVLRLDDGECLIDSAAILDHVNESLPPPHALVPARGPERRQILRLSAIATAIYERSTICYLERLRPRGTHAEAVIDAQRKPIVGGLKALDQASRPAGPIGLRPFSLATLSAVVAHEYLGIVMPELQVADLAPFLTAISASLVNEPPFANTRPVAGEA